MHRENTPGGPRRREARFRAMIAGEDAENTRKTPCTERIGPEAPRRRNTRFRAIIPLENAESTEKPLAP